MQHGIVILTATVASYRILLIGHAFRDAAMFGTLKSTVEGRPSHATRTIEGSATLADALLRLRQAVADNEPFALAFVDCSGCSAADELAVARQYKALDASLDVVVCSAHGESEWKACAEALPDLHGIVIQSKPIHPTVLHRLIEVLSKCRFDAMRSAQRIAQLEQLVVDRTVDVRGAFARLEAAEHHLAATQRGRTMRRKSQGTAGIEAQDISLALERGELSVHYQPLVEIATRKVASLEALVRWTHPVHGPIQPNEFIPVAEDSGVIIPLGEFVLRTVCEQVMRWESEGVPVVPVAVNLSAIQLQGRRIWKLVRNLLRETGMHPELLALELTETSLLSDAQDNLRDLSGLRRQGVRIEIDDFGTGYSSLSYLKRLPIDVLKIDRSFIREIDRNEADEAIVSAILSLARKLKLKVVAEGVETHKHLEILEKHGCELAQGFYFSRPLPAQASRQLLIELAKRPSFTDTLRLGLRDVSSS